MPAISLLRKFLEGIDCYYDAIVWQQDAAGNIISSPLVAGKAAEAVKKNLLTSINTKTNSHFTLADLFASTKPAKRRSLVQLTLNSHFITTVLPSLVTQLEQQETSTLSTVGLIETLFKELPYQVNSIRRGRSYYELMLRLLGKTIETGIVTAESSQAINEFVNYTRVNKTASNVANKLAVVGDILYMGGFGCAIYNDLRKKEITLSRLADSVNDNLEGLMYGSVFFTNAFSATQIPFYGIANAICVASQHRIYKKEHQQQELSYQETRLWLAAESDRLVTEFNTIKATWIKEFSSAVTSLPSETQKQQYLAIFSDRLRLLAEYYQENIDKLKGATAQKAVKLQVMESLQRVKRVQDTTEIALSFATTFFPPLALGCIVTGILNIAVERGGHRYITNTARANHGLRTNSILLIGDDKQTLTALHQMRQVKQITLAALPVIINGGNISQALAKIAYSTAFILKLPQPLPPLASDADSVELARALMKLYDNFNYLHQFTQQLSTHYPNARAPQIINLTSLQQQLQQYAQLLVRRVDNYQATHAINGSVAIEMVTLTAKLKDLLAQDDEIFNYQQTLTAPDSDYLTNLGSELLHDLANYSLIVDHIDIAEQVITNCQEIIRDITQRYNAYQGLYTTLAANPAPEQLKQFNNLTVQLKKVVARLQFMQPSAQHKSVTGGATTLAYEIAHLNREVTVSAAPGISQALTPLQVAIVPERRAFGLFKNRMLTQQISATLQHILKRHVAGQQVVIMPYASFTLADICDARDAKILRDKIEGLKTELQWLNRLAIKLNSHTIEINNMAALHHFYQAQFATINQALIRLKTRPPQPKLGSRFAVLGTKLTNFFRTTFVQFLGMHNFGLRTVESELLKATQQFKQLFSEPTSVPPSSPASYQAKTNSFDDLLLCATGKKSNQPIYLDKVTAKPLHLTNKEVQHTLAKYGLEHHEYHCSETAAMALLTNGSKAELSHIRDMLSHTPSSAEGAALVSSELPCEEEILLPAPSATTPAVMTSQVAKLQAELKLAESSVVDGKEEDEGEGDNGVHPSILH